MSTDQSKKVKLAIVGGIALAAISFAIFMILPSGESRPTQAELEAATKTQEMIKAAQEASAQGNKAPPAPPPPIKIQGGFGPSRGS